MITHSLDRNNNEMMKSGVDEDVQVSCVTVTPNSYEKRNESILLYDSCTTCEVTCYLKSHNDLYYM